MSRPQQQAISGPCFVPGPLLLPGPGQGIEGWASPAAEAADWNLEAWQELESSSGPSLRAMQLPQALLHRVDTQSRWQAAQTAMEQQLPGMRALETGFVYLERILPDGQCRPGLVGLVDLEQYSFEPGSSCPVRQPQPLSAQQVLPRAQLRETALLETSPVRLLANLPSEDLFEPIQAVCKKQPCLYEGPLGSGGGTVRAWQVNQPQLLDQLARLFAPQSDGVPLMIAVEGQCALAGAKVDWMLRKEERAQPDHPARFCLAEVGCADHPAAGIAPLHRLVMGVQGLPLLAQLEQWCVRQGIALTQSPQPGAARLTLVYGRWERTLWLKAKAPVPGVCLAEAFLQEYLSTNPMCSTDRLAQESQLRELAADGVSGILLECTGPDLFMGLAAEGILPAGSFAPFAMAESRFELECRLIAGESRDKDL